MKVLWFSITPSLGEEYINNIPTGGGWIKSLEKIIQNKVELSVAFYTDVQIDPFKLGKSTYYPIHKYRFGKVSKIRRRILNQLEPKSDIARFLEIVKIVNPDLIHIHGTEAPFGLIQKYVNIPVVVSIQGNITVYKHKYFSGISYFHTLKYSRLKSWFFMRSFILKYNYFKKQAIREKEILSLTKNILGRTSWDRRISTILAPNSNYYHCDEILRDAFYKFKWNEPETNNLNLFTTNGPNLYKGIETLIYCASLLDSNNIKFSWKVAGLNINDEIVKIASKSINKSISKNIYFLGNLNEQQIIDHLLDSRLYVAISHIENSPNSLCEALLLGMPCIATNAGGTPSLLTDDRDGILIQDGDPYAMAGAILELNNNTIKAISLGISAREKALQRHDSERIISELLNIYMKIT